MINWGTSKRKSISILGVIEGTELDSSKRELAWKEFGGNTSYSQTLEKECFDNDGNTCCVSGLPDLGNCVAI